MHDIRHDVVEEALIVRDDDEARSGERSRLTPSATTLSASMSRPESVSSSTHSRGASSAICKTSLRFFSPPEKPTLTPRRSMS